MCGFQLRVESVTLRKDRHKHESSRTKGGEKKHMAFLSYHMSFSFSQLCENNPLPPDFRFIIYKSQGHNHSYPERVFDDQVKDTVLQISAQQFSREL